MSDGLFNPEAFEQMPGQMSMEQDTPDERCEACDGRGSIPDPYLKGVRVLCFDCWGAGR